MAVFDETSLRKRLKTLREDEVDGEVEEIIETIRERLDRPAPDVRSAPGQSELAALIDHTQLRPETTTEQIHALCEEAKRYGFGAVCIPPCYLPLVRELLEGHPSRVCTVIGFPLGATQTAVKGFEARHAVISGAQEVDMVLPVGRLRSGHYAYVEEDIRTVVEEAEKASEEECIVKVILETALLTEAQKALACILAERAGADFVKTSTGFSHQGATLEDVALMHRMVGGRLGIKASGGVRSFEDAKRMVAHGATRIGASGSVAIMQGAEAETSY